MLLELLDVMEKSTGVQVLIALHEHGGNAIVTELQFAVDGCPASLKDRIKGYQKLGVVEIKENEGFSQRKNIVLTSIGQQIASSLVEMGESWGQRSSEKYEHE